MNLFGEAKSSLGVFTLPQVTEYSLDELLSKEKEYLGFYFSAHPLDSYRRLIKVFRLSPINEIKEDYANFKNLWNTKRCKKNSN